MLDARSTPEKTDYGFDQVRADECANKADQRGNSNAILDLREIKRPHLKCEAAILQG